MLRQQGQGARFAVSGTPMTEADWREVEAQLGLVVPNVYRMFMLAAASAGHDLGAHGVYFDTDTVVEGNLNLRLRLAGAEPVWQRAWLDIGLDDGRGNYYFLPAKSQGENRVCLWSQSPPEIREVGTATEFFQSVLAALKAGFPGDHPHPLRGHGPRS